MLAVEITEISMRNGADAGSGYHRSTKNGVDTCRRTVHSSDGRTHNRADADGGYHRGVENGANTNAVQRRAPPKYEKQSKH